MHHKLHKKVEAYRDKFNKVYLAFEYNWMMTPIYDLLLIYEQTAEEAMTPIESTFSLDVNSKLDW